MERGLTVASFVNFCQPGVNLCHGLVSVGQAVVDGVRCASVVLWGERHGMALLFWGKGSRSWGEWGVRWETVGVWVGR